jgi:hypothetical protein
MWPQRMEPLSDQAIATREATLSQLFQQSHCGQFGIPTEHFLNLPFIGIELALPALGARIGVGAPRFHMGQDVADGISGHS